MPKDQGLPSVAPILHAAQSPVSTPAAKRSTWEDLESSDYPTYIANLRAFGCPEGTIRDIITADVSHLYGEQMRPQAQGLQRKVLLTRLEQEKARLLDVLLGPASNADPSEQASRFQTTAALSPQVNSPQVVVETPEEVLMPLAFYDPDSSLNWTEEQKSSLKGLQKEFTDVLRTTSQNPYDPQYLQAWEETQPDSDEFFRTMFGNDALTQFQLRAYTQAAR